MLNKKILHIPNYYLPNRGGIEQVAFDIVSGLRNDYEQKVICFNHESETKIEPYDEILVYRIGYKLKVASQAISFKYFFILKKLIKEFDPDIIYIHLPNPLIVFYLLFCDIKGKKIIIHWHSDIIDQKIIKIFFLPFQKRILKKANMIFTTSEEYKNNSDDLKQFIQKVRVIPNVVNIKRFVYSEDNIINSQKITEQYKNKKILLFVGRHVPYKGLEYIIKASDLINKEAIIVIAGEGPITGELKEQAKNKNNIVFIGRLTEDKLKEYFACAYLFLFPSITKNEAFGLALAEALYCGVPAVGFQIPGSGVNWVNKDGYTGFMVENRNYVELAQKINYLLEYPDIRDKMSKNAKQWVLQNFMYDEMIAKVKKEIKELLIEI